MLGVMSEEALIRLQIFTPDRIRRRLKAQSAEQGLDMGDLGGAVLEYGLGLIAADKVPPALKALLDKAKAEKAKRDAAGEE
jgi:hypothetical protein